MKKLEIFILAGGLGTRLKEVVFNVPKPMAPICNNPFLHYQIQEIRKYLPNTNITLLTHYMSEVIENYFEHDNTISVLKEDELLGTGGSVKNAISKLKLKKDSGLLVLNGDSFLQINFLDFIKTTNEDLSIVGVMQKNCDRFGTLKLKNGLVTGFVEKEMGVCNSYINAGCYYFRTLNFFYTIDNKKFSLEEEFPIYLRNNVIEIYTYNGEFIDIGVPEDYKKFNDLIKKRK
jgi:NDP-sugar pyrophosphorylase family protein